MAGQTGIPGGLPTPPWHASGQRRTKAPARQPLTQEAIVDAALKVLDAEGYDGLSMRRVAQELDTGAASLYAHVTNKDELLDLVIDRVFGEMKIPDPDPERWQEQVRELLIEQRRILSEHRDIARALLGRIPLGPNGLVGIDRWLGILRAGNLPEKVVSWSADVLALVITASSYEDSIRQAQWASRSDEELAEYFEQMARYMKALPPDRFPNIAAVADTLMDPGGENGRFEFAVDLMIRGLASYAVDDDDARGR